jgi:5-methylcytosine-specific restriction endonuclease McrA
MSADAVISAMRALEFSDAQILSVVSEIERQRKEAAREHYTPRSRREERTLDLFERIFQRDGFKCVYCGGGKIGAGNCADRLEVDHVIPRSRGGSNEYSNLVTSCKSCNGSKKDRLLSEWRGGVHVGKF